MRIRLNRGSLPIAIGMLIGSVLYDAFTGSLGVDSIDAGAYALLAFLVRDSTS